MYLINLSIVNGVSVIVARGFANAVSDIASKRSSELKSIARNISKEGVED